MIQIDVSEQVARLTVRNFSPLSARDETFAQALSSSVIDLADDDEVKAIILRTEEDDFAPLGYEPAPKLQLTEVPEWRRNFAASHAVYQALTFAKKVTITEVNGQCSGAGALLVLASDITLASTDARFYAPFAELPESNFVLASLTMRLNRAKAWAIAGESIDAGEAERIGLINCSVAAEQLEQQTRETARQAARTPLDGIVMSKMLMQAVLDAHGVGREFDLAELYATSMWTQAGASK